MKERILGRLGKVGSQVFISATSMRQEMEAMSMERLERLAKRLNLATGAEMESLLAIVKELRRGQEAMHARLTVLESKLGINASLRKAAPLKKTSRAKSVRATKSK